MQNDKERPKFLAVNQVNECSSAVDLHREELQIFGYTVVPSVYASSELESIRNAFERVYEAQVAEIGGEEQLGLIGDKTKSRCMLAYDDAFVELAAHPRIVEVLRATLGNYFLVVSQNGNANTEDVSRIDYGWHRDLTYQHFTSSRPIMLTVIMCLDDFNEHTGGTQVIPASHKIEPCPSEQFLEANQLTVNAGAGSAIVIDSMLFHRAGINTTNNSRRGVVTIYGAPFIKQQISIPHQLGGKFKEDPLLAMLLGYDGMASESVLAWRQRAIEKNYKKLYHSAPAKE